MWKRVALVVGVALLVGGSAQGARSAAPSNGSPPTISGTASEGETLTASSGAWSGSTPMSFTYRWQRCNSGGSSCSKVDNGTNQTYKIGGKDVGHTIRVSVTATNSDGSANATSAPTAVVTKGPEPVNTSPPTISGTARAGDTLTAGNGAWTNNPTSFSYQWRRCNASGGNCGDVGADKPTYGLDAGDVGHTIRVDVKAKNQFGSNTATSAPTAVVAAGVPVPANTAPPLIQGVPREGQLLSASSGSWTNAPTRYIYQWLRCDTVGNNCGVIGSANPLRLGAADVGHTIRVTVFATNPYGTNKATSVPTAVVTRGLAAGAIKLPNGQVSLPVSAIVPPQRLVISNVRFVPTRLTSRNAFVGRFRVTDTRGYVIRDALVYVIGLPYGWIRPAPEVATATDGWASITLLPTVLMPLRHASVVFFVRARKGGDNLLSGVSSRRLVQVRVG